MKTAESQRAKNKAVQKNNSPNANQKPLGKQVDHLASIQMLNLPTFSASQRQNLMLESCSVLGNRQVQRLAAPSATQKQANCTFQPLTARTSVIQRGWWSKLKKGIRSVGRGIGNAVNSVASGIKKGAKWAWNGIKRVGSSAFKGLKGLGTSILNTIAKYGGEIGSFVKKWGLKAIGWVKSFGTKIVDWVGHWGPKVFEWIKKFGVSVVGWLWNVVKSGAARVWTLITKAPQRLFALLEHFASVVPGLVTWVWTGLKTLFTNPLGLGKWFLQGIGASTAWLLRLWSKTLDLVGFGEMVDLWAQIIKFNTRTLTDPEEKEAKKVFGNSIPYWQVRIDEASLIAKISSLLVGGDNAVTTFHTINFPRKIKTPANIDDMAWLIHELVHVAQMNAVGMQYMGEAVYALKFAGGYSYKQTDLAIKNLRDFNREQQGDIVKDCYSFFISTSNPIPGPYKKMIDQLQRGEL